MNHLTIEKIELCQPIGAHVGKLALAKNPFRFYIQRPWLAERKEKAVNGESDTDCSIVPRKKITEVFGGVTDTEPLL